MKFDKVVLASFLALSLVACGDKDDKSKPDDDKSKEPEKSAECVAAGDKCKLVDGKWVIEKKDDEPAPAVDGDFDYSDIGVTDDLKPERKGFGFYHKGANSPLDAKRFPKNKPTLSPSVAWSSVDGYDVDLWNYVAITPHSGKNSTKGDKKYMFDEIGVENQKVNQNLIFFGKTAVSSGSGTNAGVVGKSSFDTSGTGTYFWNTVPAVPNTFIYFDENGKYQRVYADESNKISYHDEADKRDGTDVSGGVGGSGKQNLRVYGVNAFLESDTSKAGNLILTSGKVATSGDTYKLVNRDHYIKHANFVYWKPSDRTGVAKDDSGLKDAKAAYIGTGAKPFPTDLTLGELKHVQFGRLTGSGVNPDAPQMTKYINDPLIRQYPFATAGNALVGNAKAEDWYFARGTAGTPLARLDSLKSQGGKIAYDGQALMFGLDYNPIKTGANKQPEEKTDSDKSTNSVMPSLLSEDNKSKHRTVLDGKQNLVRIIWSPADGHINGKVYGVWTAVDFWQATKDFTSGPTKGQIIKLKVEKGEVVPDTGKAGDDVVKKNSLQSSESKGIISAKNYIDNAVRIEALTKDLVQLKGAVIEGTNSFAGTAIRCNDGNKGLFTGGFFGPDASEIGGVINSQTGSMKNAELTDPAFKWGGAFGAQTNFASEETFEYLDIPDDPDFNYDASNEVF